MGTRLWGFTDGLSLTDTDLGTKFLLTDTELSTKPSLTDTDLGTKPSMTNTDLGTKLLGLADGLSLTVDFLAATGLRI